MSVYPIERLSSRLQQLLSFLPRKTRRISFFELGEQPFSCFGQETSKLIYRVHKVFSVAGQFPKPWENPHNVFFGILLLFRLQPTSLTTRITPTETMRLAKYTWTVLH